MACRQSIKIKIRRRLARDAYYVHGHVYLPHDRTHGAVEKMFQAQSNIDYIKKVNCKEEQRLTREVHIFYFTVCFGYVCI